MKLSGVIRRGFEFRSGGSSLQAQKRAFRADDGVTGTQICCTDCRQSSEVTLQAEEED